ncbi:hypothetical protein Pcinc_019487 [Petrolisthes cinctipes]|uniref:Uncharacterized protein n=1 Tax=Petrolisthes cinctipes TaxID=88211 RepID=A0AAE1FM17_PETCI|nr:hypothetical protein Pcinc_019487 [Petrolisthes cinctipes]
MTAAQHLASSHLGPLADSEGVLASLTASDRTAWTNEMDEGSRPFEMHWVSTENKKSNSWPRDPPPDGYRDIPFAQTVIGERVTDLRA